MLSDGAASVKRIAEAGSEEDGMMERWNDG
jgi:hypothetical protein